MQIGAATKANKNTHTHTPTPSPCSQHTHTHPSLGLWYLGTWPALLPFVVSVCWEGSAPVCSRFPGYWQILALCGRVLSMVRTPFVLLFACACLSLGEFGWILVKGACRPSCFFCSLFRRRLQTGNTPRGGFLGCGDLRAPASDLEPKHYSFGCFWFDLGFLKGGTNQGSNTFG